VEDFKRRVDQLAELMEEFQLQEATLEGEDWKVAFRTRSQTPAAPDGRPSDGSAIPTHAAVVHSGSAVAPAEPEGTAMFSPMNGIYYAQPSPHAPPFVKEGEQVQEGQVVALIEAMKVFNEIVAPFSGKIGRIVAKGGELVQPGDTLLYIVAE
jgi:acetyl-CoA carboxylase biotin carboxyl carrier protein